jgi:hypothetical protein
LSHFPPTHYHLLFCNSRISKPNPRKNVFEQ